MFSGVPTAVSAHISRQRATVKKRLPGRCKMTFIGGGDVLRGTRIQ